MKNTFQKIILLMILIIFNSVHDAASSEFSSMNIKITENIRLTVKEIDPYFLEINKLNIKAEIIIYGYTTGSEEYFKDTDGEIKTRINEGEIKSILKIIKNDKTEKVGLVSGKGRNKDELLKSLSANILNYLKDNL